MEMDWAFYVVVGGAGLIAMVTVIAGSLDTGSETVGSAEERKVAKKINRNRTIMGLFFALVVFLTSPVTIPILRGFFGS